MPVKHLGKSARSAGPPRRDRSAQLLADLPAVEESAQKKPRRPRMEKRQE
jgi:hypothetical protein